MSMIWGNLFDVRNGSVVVGGWLGGGGKKCLYLVAADT